MAGGIDWFRWHHGSVTDPKFQLVARRAGASLPDVLAVWAYILELASAATDRGLFGQVDCEAVDCMFGFPATESRTADILAAMQARGLHDGERITAWEKRQPKREDETSADRKRRQREREHEIELSASVTTDLSRDVTQRHASVTHGHDRGEESREEEIKTKQRAGTVAAPPVPAPVREAGIESHEPTQAGLLCRAIKAQNVTDVNPGHPDLLRLIAAGIPREVFTATAAEIGPKGKGFAYLLRTVEGRWRDAQAAPPVPTVAAIGAAAVDQTKAYLAAEAKHAAGAQSPEAHAARLAVMARRKGVAA